MAQEKNKLLQICGILMIIGGALGLVLSIIALIAGFAAFALLGAAGLLILVAAILALAGSVFQLITGITGVKNAAIPANAGKCITLGIINVVITIASSAVGLIGGGTFNYMSLVSGLILPVLYLMGAYQNKNKAG